MNRKDLVETIAQQAGLSAAQADAALTAFTLVQIYLRAEIQGEACKPACDAIDQFIADWEHAQKEE